MSAEWVNVFRAIDAKEQSLYVSGADAEVAAATAFEPPAPSLYAAEEQRIVAEIKELKEGEGIVVAPEEVSYTERKWAAKKIQELLAKEAHFTTLKACIGKLTSGIKVGKQFISTNDYDGSLYECKQEPFIALVSRPLLGRDDEDRLHWIDYEHITTYTEQELVAIEYPTADLSQRRVGGNYWIKLSATGYSQPVPSTFHQSLNAKYVGKSVEISFDNLNDISCKRELLRRYKVENPTIDETSEEWRPPTSACFFVKHITVEFRQLEREKYHEAEPDSPWYVRITATGYWPEYQKEESRIWVRKSNLVSLALGKNIDSSKKSIAFTLKDMAVGEMIYKELSKLQKVRKIYDKANPKKARVATLQELTKERELLNPQIDRLSRLYAELSDPKLIVPAYYCQKYGYLLPLSGKVSVDITGETLEQKLEQDIIVGKAEDVAAIRAKAAVIDNIIPAALHPDRVGYAVNRFGIEGAIGEDVLVAGGAVEGESVGYVNNSRFG